MPRQHSPARLAIVASVAFSLAAMVTSRAAQATAFGNSVAMTVYLTLRSPKAAEAQAAALQTPGDPSYHHYLSVANFAATYGATQAQIAQVESMLAAEGFTVQYVFPNNLALQAIASTDAAARVFGLKLHAVTIGGQTGIVSDTAPRIPAALAGLIEAVGGYDTLHHAQPSHRASPLRASSAAVRPALLTGGTAGYFLPQDFEANYDVTPLVQSGLTGAGTTVGIVTLNTFKPLDAIRFWQQAGLTTKPQRITLVNVDGGLTASSNNSTGELETDLDVEQSGGVATQADLRVYVSANASYSNEIDGFEAAASENIADTVSTSWGEPEAFYFPTPGVGGGQDSLLRAFHDVFLEMALQGQSVYVASFDYGAYATVQFCKVFGAPSPASPTCNDPYAVMVPASDPLVTATGGTTLPFAFTSGPVTYAITQQQAWGWRYIHKEAAAQGYGAEVPSRYFFSVGSGGGVSSYWPVPDYQAGLGGVQRTVPDQVFTEDVGTGPVAYAKFKSNYAGRNIPDVSANADPNSGYLVEQQGAIITYYGGTSFVAPELNGTTALFVQALGGRVGQLNPALYRNPGASNDIATGDNWGYRAHAGYDNTVGLGVLDGAKLLAALQAEH